MGLRWKTVKFRINNFAKWDIFVKVILCEGIFWKCPVFVNFDYELFFGLHETIHFLFNIEYETVIITLNVGKVQLN